MKEILDVTPGRGQDLVRIARPLETAGADRKLSEELMDIQPIIHGQGQEGDCDSITAQGSHDTQDTTTRGE